MIAKNLAGLLVALLAVPDAAWSQSPGSGAAIDLDPRTWDAAERRAVEAAMQHPPADSPLARGRLGAISATSNAPAVYAGLTALERGGSAADAALTTAVAQVTLAAGAGVSLSGTLSFLYYDAASGRVFSLNADYNTVRGEGDPLSIPQDMPSGRAALIPGFVAGVEAAHGRFGLLPFAALLQPAIAYAEEGFVVSPDLAGLIAQRQDVLTRLPAAREIFVRPDGALIAAGDRLRQPALAATLRQIAAQGADYFYAGPWAERFVAAVNAEGGRVTLDDLDGYHAWWTTPVRTRFRDYEVYSYGLPATGGVNALEALELWEVSGLAAKGHYAASGDSLFWLAQIERVVGLSALPAAALASLAPGLDLSLESRLEEATAAALWQRISRGEFALTQAPAGSPAAAPPRHSDAIVAVDRWGNMAAVAHSINSLPWGKTGIFVDGVSINDSASFQQAAIAAAGPGERLPAPASPLIVLADGRPVLASSAIGPGLHGKALQAVINVLDFGRDPKEANDAPYLMAPHQLGDGAVSQRVPRDAFAAQVLARARALGLEIEELAVNSPEAQGLWVGIARDAATGDWLATSPKVSNGAAFAEREP